MRVISPLSDRPEIDVVVDAAAAPTDWDDSLADFLLAATAANPANPPEQRREVFYPHFFQLSVFQPHDSQAGEVGEPQQKKAARVD